MFKFISKFFFINWKIEKPIKNTAGWVFSVWSNSCFGPSKINLVIENFNVSSAWLNNSFTISAISKIEDDSKKEQVILNDFMNAIRNNKDYLKEFDEVEVKKTKKVGTQNNIYLSFDIVGKLKRKITKFT